MINVEKLHGELEAAGIPIDGVSSDGRVDFRPEATEEQRTQAAAILAAHDPTEVAVVDPNAEQAELDAGIGAAMTLADLKKALLGSRGGRVKARPGA